MYEIQVYNEKFEEWENCFPYDPDGIYPTYEDARYQVDAMQEVDDMHGEKYEYRIIEIVTDTMAIMRDLNCTEEEAIAFQILQERR